MTLVALLLFACSGDDDPKTSVQTSPPTTDTGMPVDLDLTERLGAGEARAGVIREPGALFAGISAEGRPGDVKIYNDRVQFVIQGVRDGSYYLTEGGGVIDADIVRPEGELGRDLVDEWGTMIGLGRVLTPETVEVVQDGSDGGPALVRVVGREDGLGLLEGVLEAEGFVSDLGLEAVTEYELAPDSWLLTVRTTVTATDDDVEVPVGDLLLGAPEAADLFVDGAGMDAGTGVPRRWTGYVAKQGDGAVIMVPPPGETWGATGFELVTELAEMAASVSPITPIAVGESVTVSRSWGVGPDLATLTDAALELHGTATEVQAGTVTAPDGPVAGARVTFFEDGAPMTVAFTDEAGAFQASVPTGGGAITWRASGRHTGRFFDLPEGAVSYAPYADEAVQQAVLDNLVQGGPGRRLAEGRGVASEADPLVLGEPAILRVRTDDMGPFAARLGFTKGDPVSIDHTWVHGRPDGLAAAGWAAMGELVMEVEPGTYDLTVHRGIRYELHRESVSLAAGEELVVDAMLLPAYDHDGWILGDPHSHASPSPDGAISMEERLLVQGGVGLQVHFGTDHDHLADYRPLVDATGLTPHLVSIVADEVSPPLRGHMNIYPVVPDPTLPNGGAWRWWSDIPENTEDLVDTLRLQHGDGFILQSNHPTDSGVMASADWSPGEIGSPDYFTERIEAMEVLNAADNEDYLDVWWDLVSRGYEITPTGVSDSHSHFGGSPGLSATWMHTGGDLVDLTDDDVESTFRGGRVVPTRGPFLDLSLLPGEVDAGTVIDVAALSPSWIVVDRLQLWQDGQLVEEVPGTTASFTLDPMSDAVFTIVAEGDTPMQPLTGRTPWAMTGAYRVDVAGDGFDPPLPPLVFD